MKISKIVFILLMVFVANNIIANDADVNTVVANYVKAIKARDTNVLENIVNSDFDFIRMNNILNKKETKETADYLEFVKSGQFSAWAKDISSNVLDVKDKIAVAVVNYGSTRLTQTEYLTLFKEEDGWVIAKSVCSFGKK